MVSKKGNFASGTNYNVHRIKMCITAVSRPVGWPARSWFIGDYAPVFLE